MKIVLVGAGSAQFGLGMVGDIFTSNILEGAEISLLDINPDSLKRVHVKCTEFIKQHKLNYTVSSTLNRKEAFQNANFIIISIEVGDRFQLWEEDWKIPLQYGIRQVYGENGGPGGTFHALRVTPPILEMVADSQEICPDATIFCFTNPMTAICTTVQRAFPKAKFIGMCHEIASLEKHLPKILDLKYEEMDTIAAGLNHFSCLLEIKEKKTGKDLYPQVLTKAPSYFKKLYGTSDGLLEALDKKQTDHKEGFTEIIAPRKESQFEWVERGLFKFIMETYKLLPITTDSHFGEYLSWAWDTVDHRGILDFFDLYKIYLSTPPEETEIALQRHERAVYLIEAIVSDQVYVEPAVNIMNNGLIPGIPDSVAVEVPATISAKGIEGITPPPIPRGMLGLLRNYASAYDILADAIISKNKDLVIQSLLANPVVDKAHCLPEMTNRMIDLQKKWLGYLK
ncbi:MAG: alpha-glucosidase [Brevinema sp.]